MARWTGPLVVGALVAALTGYGTIAYAPDLLMAAAIRRVAAGGFNRFAHSPLATATSRQIVRPSPDLAYSACPYDISRGSLLIHAVPVASPYWSLSIFDSRTNAVFVRNGGQAGGKPFAVAITHPGRSVPTGYQRVDVVGERGIALVRILVVDRGAFPGLDAARRATVCELR